MRDTDLAYLAGIIDSDGYITIHQSCRKGVFYHAPQVGIAGTRRQPHDMASDLFGGRVGCYLPKNPSHRPQFQWSLQGRRAVPVIECVFRFLRVKKAQAILALELWRNITEGRSDDPFPWFGPDYNPTAARRRMREEMIHLNQSRNRIRQRHNGFPEVLS